MVSLIPYISSFCFSISSVFYVGLWSCVFFLPSYPWWSMLPSIILCTRHRLTANSWGAILITSSNILLDRCGYWWLHCIFCGTKGHRLPCILLRPSGPARALLFSSKACMLRSKIHRLVYGCEEWRLRYLQSFFAVNTLWFVLRWIYLLIYITS